MLSSFDPAWSLRGVKPCFRTVYCSTLADEWQAVFASPRFSLCNDLAAVGASAYGRLHCHPMIRQRGRSHGSPAISMYGIAAIVEAGVTTQSKRMGTQSSRCLLAKPKLLGHDIEWAALDLIVDAAEIFADHA